MDQKAARQHALQQQLERLDGRIAQLDQQSQQLSRLRLALFLAAAFISGVTFLTWGAWPWLVVTLIVFIPFLVVVFLHRRVDTAVIRWQTWRQIKQTHLARMTLDWDNLPPPLPFTASPDHPFATDLDVMGEYSLHRLLDTAVSDDGSARLRDWLLDTRPHPDPITYRQTLTQELTAMPLFRDKLHLYARLSAPQGDGKMSGQQLQTWLEQPDDSHKLRRLLFLLIPLSALNILLFWLRARGVLPPIWVLTWGLYLLLYLLAARPAIGSLFADIMTLRDGLDTLNGVFGFLEGYRYGRSPHVKTLCAPFLDAQKRPSAHLQRIRRAMSGVGLTQHPLLGFLINAVVPWDAFFAYHLANRKKELRTDLPQWLNVWFELEALSSLGNFAWLNPGEICYPQIIPVNGNQFSVIGELSPEAAASRQREAAVQFEARQIGHPLIPSPERVCNDYAIAGIGSVTIVTGSNMAGKSSFLRTLGINLVLAYSGAPVVAQALHASLFRLFASIRVQDSLTDGYSFFYAEVRRLAQLLDALQDDTDQPVFYLIDEIFRGTNNRERLIGSKAYIEALTAGNGLGLIATHDLELVQLAEVRPSIHNAHFRDEVRNGRMLFDYKLHPGPCPTTNALKIMEMAGLPT
ncbi:MAG: hypothetical protein HF973_05815 [Chloroflexi bacterium]|nr:hypothetical protein [Chloroflexota bacterium]